MACVASRITERMAAPKNTVNHFEALDGWRGLCACLVVLFHFHGYSPIYSWGLIRNSYLFVDFFFVLSGFVIAWNYGTRLGTWRDVRQFLVLRVGRLYPLHIFMLFVFLAWETAKLLLGHQGPNGTAAFTGETQPGTVLSNIFLVQSLHLNDTLSWNAPSWSISTELWAYVVFAVVSVTFGLRNWMIALLAAAAPVFLLQVTHTGMDITYDWGLVRCLFGFALGVACARIYRARRDRFAQAGTAAATVLESIALAAVAWYVSYAGKSDWSLLAPFVFAAAVLVFANERGAWSGLLQRRLFKWLGTLSYSIYLTHYFFVVNLPIVVHRVLHLDLTRPMPLPGGGTVPAYGRNDVEGTLFYLLVLGLTIAFSAFTYRWIETPGRNFSRNWARRLAARAAVDPAPASVSPQ
jgi:peptidoglycan/LPS O-acetylase OafA/YrhL